MVLVFRGGIMAIFIRFCLFSLVLLGQANACAVCTGGQTEEVQSAYIWITILLSLTPIIGFGVFLFIWFKRQSKTSTEEE